MSLKVGELYATMGIDDREFNTKLDSGKSKFSSAGSFLAGKGALLASAVGLSFAAVGGAAFDSAIKLEGMDKKAKIVFGSEIDMVQKWAKANAHGMGLTKQEAVGVAASFADLLIPMGFARNEAAGMSTEVIGLSGALAEWSGGQLNATQVADILAKAMLGEREGLKQVGISISEADIQQQLLLEGKEKLTGAALAQAEALATEKLLFDQSKDAQDAFAGSTDDLASKSANAKAQLTEAWQALVQKMIPALTDLVEVLSDVLKIAGPVVDVLWKLTHPWDMYEFPEQEKAADYHYNQAQKRIAALKAKGYDTRSLEFSVPYNLPGKAFGGLVTQPGAYPLAEDYQPELVMPLTKPRRMQELAGQYLGMDSSLVVAAIDALGQRFDNYEAQRRADLRDIRLGMGY